MICRQGSIVVLFNIIIQQFSARESGTPERRAAELAELIKENIVKEAKKPHGLFEEYQKEPGSMKPPVVIPTQTTTTTSTTTTTTTTITTTPAPGTSSTAIVTTQTGENPLFQHHKLYMFDLIWPTYFGQVNKSITTLKWLPCKSAFHVI